MARAGRSATEGRVKRVKEQIDCWRGGKRKRCSPMPERLWREATVLAREFGVHRMKCALGLNYKTLKKRVQKSGDQERARAPVESPGFVEWSGAQVVSPGRHERGALVEVHDAIGGRLTIQLGAGSDLDVASLVEAYSRHRA